MGLGDRESPLLGWIPGLAMGEYRAHKALEYPQKLVEASRPTLYPKWHRVGLFFQDAFQDDVVYGDSFED